MLPERPPDPHLLLQVRPKKDQDQQSYEENKEPEMAVQEERLQPD